MILGEQLSRWTTFCSVLNQRRRSTKGCFLSPLEDAFNKSLSCAAFHKSYRSFQVFTGLAFNFRSEQIFDLNSSHSHFSSNNISVVIQIQTRSYAKNPNPKPSQTPTSPSSSSQSPQATLQESYLARVRREKIRATIVSTLHELARNMITNMSRGDS